jgi:thiamine-monophosphate kinase
MLVATTDTLLEGIHFDRKWFGGYELGQKLLAVNLSDLAAMGGVKPLAALVTVALPGDTPVNFVDKFYKGLRSYAQRWKIGFLGGDTVGSKRDRMVSATVFGEADPRHIVRRDTAKQDDVIGVVGPLGLAAAGLEVLEQRRTALRWARPLIDAFSKPIPQFEAAALLARRPWATSLIDASDGLEASLKLISESSGLGVQLDPASLTVHPALNRWTHRQKKNPIHYIMRGGEDYALVFTAHPKHWPAIQRSLPRARRIGSMVARRQGQVLNSYGYSHF